MFAPQLGRLLAAVCLCALAVSLFAERTAAHSPHDVTEVLEVSPFYAQDGTALAVMVLSEHRVLARTMDHGKSWQTYGAQPAQYQVQALCFSPAFDVDGTLFMATRSNGVWRSTDRGSSWMRIDQNLALPLLDMDISPDFANDQRLLLATTAGCQASQDGGQTWTPSSTGLAETILQTIAFAPGAGNVVFAGRTRLHRSNNGGLNWTPVGDPPGQITAIAISPDFAQDGVLEIGLMQNGVYVSTNGGLSVQAHQTGLLETEVNDVAIAADGTVFCVTHGSVYRAAGAGQPWTQAEASLEPLSELTTDHYASIAPTSTFDTDATVYLGSYEGIFRSLDGAGLWRQCDTYTQRINRSVVFSPGFAIDRTVLFTNYGAGPLFRLPQQLGTTQPPQAAPGTIAGTPHAPPAPPSSPPHGAGRSLQPSPPLAGPAPTLQPYGKLIEDTRADDVSSLHVRPTALSPDFLHDGTLFVGHEGMWRSHDRGLHWTRVQLPPGVTIVRGLAVTPGFPANPLLFLGTPGEGLFRSLDEGATWQRSNAGLPADFRCREIVVSPAFAQDGRVYAISNEAGIWGSVDGGFSWSSMNVGVGNTATLRALRLSPDFADDGTLVMAAKSLGVLLSTDFGASWTAINNGLPDLGGIDAEGVAISPEWSADHTLFATVARGGSVFRSTDAGASWQPADTGLPLTLYRDLDVTPTFGTDRTLIVNSNEWSWISTDAGDSWSRLPATLRVDDTSHQVVYDHQWTRVEYDASHSTGVSAADQAGDWFEYEFYGDSIAWFVVTAPDAGRADVLLDGVFQATVDLYSPTVQEQVRIWGADLGRHAWHTLRIEVGGTAQRGSAGTWVRSDAVEYTFDEWPLP